MKITLFLVLFFIETLSAQNIKIGISSNLVSGKITEPLVKIGKVISSNQSWKILQLGITIEYFIYRSELFSIKGMNEFNYGWKNDAYRYHEQGPIPNPYILNTNINYMFIINHAFLFSININRHFSFDTGFKGQMKSYEYEDTITNIVHRNQFLNDLGKRSFKEFNIGPIIQVNAKVVDFLSLVLGISYNIFEEEHQTQRIREPSMDISHSGIKKINRSEYFLKLMYSF